MEKPDNNEIFFSQLIGHQN